MVVMMDNTFSQPDTASTTLELEERDLPLLAHAKWVYNFSENLFKFILIKVEECLGGSLNEGKL
jgi:hypothetical protein